ncbi:MAG: DNA translocase FtsK [Thermoanaerobaculia bacterium]
MVGVVCAVAGLLLAVSLLSYDPEDPSWLHGTMQAGEIHNLIGRVGAEVADTGFGLFGLAIFVAPLLALGAAWRRLRPRTETRQVVGRGIGAVLLLASLPPLLQLALGEVVWRGRELEAGGGIGSVVGGALESWLGLTGALLLVLGGVIVGATLLVQSTLGEALAGWRRRFADLGQRASLAWARRRERRHKERMRERVLAKQMERAGKPRVELPPAPAVDPSETFQAREVQGRGKFSIRKVRAESAGEAAAPPPSLHPSSAPPAPARPDGGETTARTRRSQAPVQAEMPVAKVRRDTLPPIDLLRSEPLHPTVEESELLRLGEVIRSRCSEFGVEGTVEGISPGPVITVFEFQPAPGVKVSQIVNLQDDLALALKAEAVRIDRIAGRSTLGIEVPNRDRGVIRLGALIDDQRFKRAGSPLTMALGTTIHGEPFYADLATMPHLLVAGATGSGKSVGLQSMITSILYKATREEVQFIFIDPKRIELGVYADIPHLKAEVVVEPKKAANALRWTVAEMERRYRLLAEVHVRNIEHYNSAIADPELKKRLALTETESEFTADDLQPLPYYVVIIDELADLMMVASSEVETSIARLAQMARAVGIHLIIATQRPSVDVLTGTIKANFPCRISYATATRHDSRTILDQVGSEKLLGKGDMLFMPPGTSRAMRLHGAYVSEPETAGLIRWLKRLGPPDLDESVLEGPEEERAGGEGAADYDELFDEAARLVVSEGKASASFLQRRLRVGFSRAARLIDLMEQDGLLGPAQGSKPRDVLVGRDYFEEVDRAREDA